MKDHIARKVGGDGGDVVVLGNRIRVDRDSLLITLQETLTELNAWMGVIASMVTSRELKRHIPTIQHDICQMCDQLGLAPSPILSEKHLLRIEEMLAAISDPSVRVEETQLANGPLSARFVYLVAVLSRRARRQLSEVLSWNNAIGAAGVIVLSGEIAEAYLERLEQFLKIAAAIETR